MNITTINAVYFSILYLDSTHIMHQWMVISLQRCWNDRQYVWWQVINREQCLHWYDSNPSGYHIIALYLVVIHANNLNAVMQQPSIQFTCWHCMHTLECAFSLMSFGSHDVSTDSMSCTKTNILRCLDYACI